MRVMGGTDPSAMAMTTMITEEPMLVMIRM